MYITLKEWIIKYGDTGVKIKVYVKKEVCWV